MAINKYQFVPVYIQSFYVQGSGPLELAATDVTNQVRTLRADSGDLLSRTTLSPLSYVQTLNPSSVPTISEIELRKDYQELGVALSEMTRLDADEEWKIERPVLETARLVAGQLVSLGVPAPQIFNHGTKSIVFSWSNQADSLYLTLSADRVSALLSSPERIKRRAQLPLERLSQFPIMLLGFRSNGEPVALSSSVNSTPDFAS